MWCGDCRAEMGELANGGDEMVVHGEMGELMD
jgi:hypothetical protein